MHDVPEELGGEGVAADEEVFELPDVPIHAAEATGADAAHAFVGVDLDEGLLNFVSLVVDL